MMAWLRCGGAAEVVRQPMMDWVNTYATDRRVVDLVEDLVRIEVLAPHLISTLLTAYAQASRLPGWQKVLLKLVKPVQQYGFAASFYDTCESSLMPLVKGESVLPEKANP